MKKLFITLITFSFCTIGFGQNLSFLQQLELIFADIIEVDIQQANMSQINQNGDFNDATVNQRMDLTGNNVSNIQQIGNSNNVSLNQIGDNNTANIIQLGNNNINAKNISGSNIQSLSQQIGNNNSIFFVLNSTFEYQTLTNFTQFGSENLIDVSFYSSNLGYIPESGILLNANQIGNNHSLTGAMDTLGPQVSITQFGGFSGEGMQVNINTFSGHVGAR